MKAKARVRVTLRLHPGYATLVRRESARFVRALRELDVARRRLEVALRRPLRLTMRTQKPRSA